MGDGKFLPLFDIYETGFLDYKGIKINFIKDGGRVVFEVPADDETYRLLREYQSDPKVSLLGFVGSLRRVRAKMLDVRDGGRRQGRDGREMNHGRSE
jgi:hypothetical protein